MREEVWHRRVLELSQHDRSTLREQVRPDQARALASVFNNRKQTQAEQTQAEQTNQKPAA